MEEGVSPFEAEAMRVKSCIGPLWEKKLKARKDAYWGYVKNSGNLRFHEKWMSANPRIVIPRKLQKFEMKYENDQQRALRERSVLQDFKNEIEMEKLKTDACIERYRKIDAEIEEIILSKCSGPVADLLFEQWRMNVQKNEDISHKRWSNNDKWLKSYEAEFLKTYEHSNPFFKEGNSGKNYKPTFVDVVNSNPEGFGQQGRPPNSKFTPNGFQNRPQNSQGFTPNGARNMQSRGFRPNGAFNRQQESNFSPKAHQNGQHNRQYDALSLLNDLLQQNNSEAQNNGRGRGRFNNRSNNSDWYSAEDVVTADPPNSFLSADRNWNYRI